MHYAVLLDVPGKSRIQVIMLSDDPGEGTQYLTEKSEEFVIAVLSSESLSLLKQEIIGSHGPFEKLCREPIERARELEPSQKPQRKVRRKQLSAK